MSAMGFRSVFMVASCAGAALGCYLVSLRVASERAALENVETQIVLAERDIRLLETEIGTRGRLAQLERWNVKVLALSAPSADQFLGGSFELARMVAPERKVDLQAPVVLASAPATGPRPRVEGVQQQSASEEDKPVSGKGLLHTASLKSELPSKAAASPAKSSIKSVSPKAPTKPRNDKAADAGSIATKSAKAVASAQKPPATKSVDKPAATTPKAVTKPVKVAKSDPLAPIPAAKRDTSTKDSGRKQ